jgi:hypothetical protein
MGDLIQEQTQPKRAFRELVAPVAKIANRVFGHDLFGENRTFGLFQIAECLR